MRKRRVSAELCRNTFLHHSTTLVVMMAAMWLDLVGSLMELAVIAFLVTLRLRFVFVCGRKAARQCFLTSPGRVGTKRLVLVRFLAGLSAKDKD